MKTKLSFFIFSAVLHFIGCERKDIKTEIHKDLIKLYAASSDGLILREKPSRDSKKILLIPFGAETEVLEDFGEPAYIDGFFALWKKIRYNQKVGYVFSAYLTENLKDYRELQKKDWKGLEDLGKSFFSSDPKKSSHLYSLAFLKRNGGSECHPESKISDLNKCTEQCLKAAEPIYCGNFQNIFHQENFQNTASLISEKLEKGNISEIMKFSLNCIQGQRICYHCDGFALSSTAAKLGLIQEHRDRIDFSTTKISSSEKTVEFFPKKNTENGLYRNYMGNSDEYMKNEPFLKFRFRTDSKKDENWKIEYLDGRILILNPERFCYLGE